jgi:hypothetical protein
MEAHLNIGNLTQGSFALYVSGRRLSYVKVLGEGVMVQFAISPQLGSRFAKERLICNDSQALAKWIESKQKAPHPFSRTRRQKLSA